MTFIVCLKNHSLLQYYCFFLPITDHNYALHKSAYQKSTYDSKSAGNAVDGSLTTISQTNHYTSGSTEWWEVDLGKRILLREVVVYVKKGKFSLEESKHEYNN